MNSLFSFLGDRAEPSEEEPSVEPAPAEAPPAAPAPGEQPIFTAPPATMAEPLPDNTAFSADEALTRMLEALGELLKDPPTPGISVASVTERALALGNRRGTERRGSFAAVELKGGRLDAVARFQFLADEADGADAAVTALQGRLLAARDALWAAGFLRMSAEETSLAEHISTLNAWRKTADYRVLYEYHYPDTDGAESIIARIPIHTDPEERDSLQRETTVVTDEMVRWDNEAALPLEVAATARSSVRVTGLASLAYLPAGWTGNQVTLARLDRESTDPPTDYPTLAEFHAAVTNPTDPDRHAQVAFGSVADFLAAFESAGDPIELGDWDEDDTPDEYQPGTLGFDPPIRLETGDDLFRLSYQDAAFDTPAVVYLRAEARGV